MKKITLLFLLFIAQICFAQNIIFEDNFDDQDISDWTLYDEDGDGFGWSVFQFANETPVLRSSSWVAEPTQMALTPDNYAISPPIDLTNVSAGTSILLIWDVTAADPSFADENYSVYVATGNSVADMTSASISFTEVVTDNGPGGLNNVYTKSIDISSFAGSTVYVGFRHHNVTDQFSLEIDDVRVESGCTSVTGISFDDFSDTTVDISWSNEPGDYEIEYGEFPYTQGSGGTVVSVSGQSSAQLTNLASGIAYDVFVRQICGSSSSNYSGITVGTSISAVNSYPYFENFEPDANQAFLFNLGISFEGTTNPWELNTDDPNDTNEDLAFDGTTCFFSNNTFADTNADSYLYLGPFNMVAGEDYTVTFQQRNFVASTGTIPNKDLNVTISQTADGSGDTIIQSFVDMDNTSYQERSAVYTPTMTGEYYIGFQDASEFLSTVNAGNLVIIDAVEVESTLSTEEFDNFNFNYFVNTQSKLNLSASQPFSHIALYSLTGKEVLSKSLNAQTEVVDLNDLSTGIYVTKIQINNTVKSFKIIKK